MPREPPLFQRSCCTANRKFEVSAGLMARLGSTSVPRNSVPGCRRKWSAVQPAKIDDPVIRSNGPNLCACAVTEPVQAMPNALAPHRAQLSTQFLVFAFT